MLGAILKVIGLFVATFATLALVVVLYFVANIYVVSPLHHRMRTIAADRANEETYRSGNAYVFDIALGIDVGGQARSETTSITCIPKQETQLTFKSGPMEWDMLVHLENEPPQMRLPLPGRARCFSKLRTSTVRLWSSRIEPAKRRSRLPRSFFLAFRRRTTAAISPAART